MSSLDYLDLCRLCLVKDRVGISIFEDEGDARQVFLKIASCLPVKVSREDKLPKKICDDCMYKLELFYQFWNTTANAEKQLLQWLDDVDMQDKQGYVTEVLNPSLMKQEQQASENRLDENVLQVGTHQNNMGMGMMDNMGLGMPIIISTTNQPMTSVSMDTSGSSVQTIQAVPGTSTQSTHDQISQNQVTNVHHNVDEDSDDDEENESDDECDADDGLPVKEENEDDPNNRTVEPTTFVNVSLPCDEAGPSGLQQQKITEMPEMAMPQIANADNKTGKLHDTFSQNLNISEIIEISDIEEFDPVSPSKIHLDNQNISEDIEEINIEEFEENKENFSKKQDITLEIDIEGFDINSKSFELKNINTTTEIDIEGSSSFSKNQTLEDEEIDIEGFDLSSLHNSSKELSPKQNLSNKIKINGKFTEKLNKTINNNNCSQRLLEETLEINNDSLLQTSSEFLKNPKSSTPIKNKEKILNNDFSNEKIDIEEFDRQNVSKRILRCRKTREFEKKISNEISLQKSNTKNRKRKKIISPIPRENNSNEKRILRRRKIRKCEKKISNECNEISPQKSNSNDKRKPKENRKRKKIISPIPSENSPSENISNEKRILRRRKIRQCEKKISDKSDVKIDLNQRETINFNQKFSQKKSPLKFNLEENLKQIKIEESENNISSLDNCKNSPTKLNSNKNIKIIICEICFATFNSPSKLGNHVKTKHITCFKFYCDICNVPFINQLKLTHHMKNCHVKKIKISQNETSSLKIKDNNNFFNSIKMANFKKPQNEIEIIDIDLSDDCNDNINVTNNHCDSKKILSLWIKNENNFTSDESELSINNYQKEEIDKIKIEPKE
ncbi:uncharacterized protein PF3D7_1120600-like isoform X4 [Leptopilina boulardi]|uniref:uncharacterized protein PF3D7_1120600-like isoform X4 n=1 Tax=Leptopilina boulardi TaxID=63433 RepID=UPI0021F62F17|nr:uncharacterized protein PF3D7_1120600-like isoform X4 [Leptopilina boulardi]